MGSVTNRLTSPSRWRRARVAVTVAAIVFGIVGMHGLSLRCTNAASATPTAMIAMTGPTGMSGTGPAAHTPDRDPHALSHSDPTPPGPTLAGSSHAPAGHGGTGDMMMLCVAMLAAAASALVALLATRRAPQRHRTLTRTPSRSIVSGPVPSCAGTGPPHVWAFSVIRC